MESSSSENGKGTLLGLYFLFDLLLPILLRTSMSESVHSSNVKDLTLETSSPSAFLCKEAHLPQRNIPKLHEAHVGYVDAQSAHLLSLARLFTISINCLSICF